MNENYVSDLELGRKEACLGILAALAQAFEIKLAELFPGIGEILQRNHFVFGW